MDGLLQYPKLIQFTLKAEGSHIVSRSAIVVYALNNIDLIILSHSPECPLLTGATAARDLQ